MYIRIPIIASLIFIISSCSVNRLVTDANTSFSKHEYFAASEKYKVAQQKIKDSSKKSSVYFNMAESYQKLGDYAKAATWYKSALRTGYKDSTLELRYADALRGSGKPELALPVYETVRKSDPRNKWAINGAESVNLISKWKKTPELYIVENLKSINSIQHDVVSQIVPDSEKSIILRSSRENPGEKKVNPATGQKFSSFYTATFDTLKKKWSPPLLLSEPATANSPEEEIDINISTNKKLIVFARLVQQPLKPAISQLFCMQKNNEEWSTPEIIQFCTEEADFTHPMLTEDGKTLWFASNKTGGNGGFDIWKSTISSSGTFSEPENAGPEINTPGNEIFPFEKPNGYLYFSSDFHPGIGGYDIFKAQQINGKWQIEQLPPPLNSAGDDVSVQFFGIQEKGYFSSNRKGSRGFDIYSFYLPPKLFQCFGKIHDSETDSILPDVNIRVVGSDGSSQKIRSVNGRFTADLNPESDYAIVVYANGYLNAQAKLSTRGLREPKNFEVDIRPIPTNKPIRIDNINYELGKWELLPQAKTSLEKLVDILKLNPEAVVEISAHTDDTGDDRLNQELSEKRAASVVDYLQTRGIAAKNLKARGYGETLPLKVNRKIAGQYKFLPENMVLNSANIEKLTDAKQKEIARSLNRRTEFKVLQAGRTADFE